MHGAAEARETETRVRAIRRIRLVSLGSRQIASANPNVGNFARQKNALASTHAKSLIANLKIKLTLDDVDLLVLVEVQVARPAACSGECGDCRWLALPRWIELNFA